MRKVMLLIAAISLLVFTVTSPVIADKGGIAHNPQKLQLPKKMKAQGKLKGGGSFDGTLSDPELSVTDEGMFLSGTLEGTLKKNGKTKPVKEEIVDEPISEIEQTEGTCHILTLSVDNLFLDLLGLQVVISDLDLTVQGAETGPLGSLLCDLVNALGG
jgi:hypothetical protein